jgi:hypothetical protein
MNTILQAIAPNPHTNLLNVYTQLANKMGVQPKKKSCLNICQLLMGLQAKILFIFTIYHYIYIYIYELKMQMLIDKL